MTVLPITLLSEPRPSRVYDHRQFGRDDSVAVANWSACAVISYEARRAE